MAADMVKIDLYPQAYFQGCKMSTESCISQTNKGAKKAIFFNQWAIFEHI